MAAMRLHSRRINTLGKDKIMKKSVLNILFVASLAVGLSACNSMTTQQRNTAAGAVIGGAALGGVIGSQVHKWH